MKPDRTRRLLVSVLAWLLATGVAVAAPDDWRVLSERIGGVPPSEMVETHLKKLAFAALDRRDADFEKLQTVDHLRTWQRDRREAFLAALGGFPARTPLNARVIGRMTFADYRLEKIIFESQPGFFVTATLYLPLTSGPHPAAVHPTGHSANAKARDLYQRASILLAKNGVACLCYDPIGQGERRYEFGAGIKQPFGTTEEHALMGVGCTLLGTSLARYMIWDGMRAVDYLQGRADVDPTRIGCLGISGGGTMTSYLSALDERIAASAPGCYLTGYRRLLETIGPGDCEQNLFGQIANGLDHSDYVMMRAPRTTLVMVATKDFFDIDGAWQVFRQAKRFYTKFGFAERVDIVEADTPHGFPTEMRVGAARWFQRWFLGRDTAVTEADFPVLPDEQLHCTPGGQVHALSGARSIFDLNRDWEERLAVERRQIWRDKTVALKEVRRITGIRAGRDLAAAKAEPGREWQRSGFSIRQVVLEPEPGIWLPALAFEPADRVGTGERILYLHADGKHADAGPDGPIEKLVQAGHRVLAVDLRGIGETKRAPGKDRFEDTLGREWRETTIAEMLGKSLLAMRAEDILVCARYLAGLQRAPGEMPPVRVVAIGEVGVPALHAAALEPQMFSTLEIERSLASWVDVLKAPLTRNQKVNTVFGALRAYDLPDLAGSLPPGKITIANPQNATENRISRILH